MEPVSNESGVDADRNHHNVFAQRLSRGLGHQYRHEHLHRPVFFAAQFTQEPEIQSRTNLGGLGFQGPKSDFHYVCPGKQTRTRTYPTDLCNRCRGRGRKWLSNHETYPFSIKRNACAMAIGRFLKSQSLGGDRVIANITH